ncbi:ATP-binding protein [Marivita sp.]|uniref:ATP-binding protein n=1 Tax=Marivita sp. TaxID=2003365 RepID=UPI0026254969|nr:ATP-binding protein [Marivita sp.]
MTLGARQSSRINLDLRRPVEEAADLIRSSLHSAARLTVTVPETPVEALADPTDVLQLLLNLGINARDAIADSPGAISIRLSSASCHVPTGAMAVGRVDPARRYACLTVEDTGPGMPPDVASRILTPYFSTKGDLGTGLGLAVVSSVIEDNGGALSLTTELGKGTKFEVFWPIDMVEQPVAPDDPDFEGTGRLDGRMILVVDDQPEVLDVITAYLEAAGAEVAATTNPEDVLDALRDDPDTWDLLVTDYDMPGMTGAELTEAAKAIVPNLPSILVTALAGEAGRSGALFTAVLSKPIDRQSLVLKSELALMSSVEQHG